MGVVGSEGDIETGGEDEMSDKEDCRFDGTAEIITWWWWGGADI